MFELIYPSNGANGFWVFVLVTLAIGGAAAVATGRAIATTWRPFWQIALYVLLLTAVVRFLQYALFQQPLLSLPNFVADAAILFTLAVLGHRRARARQMTTQYPWIFEPSGAIGWRPRSVRHGGGALDRG